MSRGLCRQTIKLRIYMTTSNFSFNSTNKLKWSSDMDIQTVWMIYILSLYVSMSLLVSLYRYTNISYTRFESVHQTWYRHIAWWWSLYSFHLFHLRHIDKLIQTHTPHFVLSTPHPNPIFSYITCNVIKFRTHLLTCKLVKLRCRTTDKREKSSSDSSNSSNNTKKNGTWVCSKGGEKAEAVAWMRHCHVLSVMEWC